jgi:tetratricopeptide (TPR) repeat protein/DNA-binding SARP family transcriptional activator
MTDSPDDVIARAHAATMAKIAGATDIEAGLQAALDSMADQSAPTFRILGPTSITVDGEPTSAWGKPRERAILAVLLLHANRPVPLTTILEWAWPDDAPRPANPATTIHTYAARLRHALRGAAGSPQIRAQHGAYRLTVNSSAVDYHRFVHLRRKAQELLRSGHPGQATQRARHAIGLWQGPPLDELSSDRAAAWRHGVMAREWLPANITLLEALLVLGEITEVLARLDTLHSDHGHELELMKLRLDALYALNRVTEATAFYFHARRTLLDAGNDPGAEHLRQCHDNLRAGRTQHGTSVHASGRLVPRQLPGDTLFVGRASALIAIDAASQTGSRGRLITVEGPPGIGKTTLAVRWARSARHRFPDGEIYINLSRYTERPDITVPSVVDDLLIAFGQPLTPALGLHAKKVLTRQLLEDRRILVLLDDAQDTPHLRELIDLFIDCLVIATSRAPLRRATEGFHPHRVVVGPMTRGESTELLLTRVGEGRTIPEEDLGNLVRTAHGSPLMVSILAEYVLSLPPWQSTSATPQLVTETATPIQLLTLSYQALPAPERRLFRLLGLHPGPEFSLATARAVADGTTDQARRGLSALVGAHLLSPVDTPDRYHFHDIVHAFAAQCAETDEAPAARTAAEQRGLNHYIAAATQAHRWLRGDHGVPGFEVAEAVEAVVFTNTAQSRTWFDRERGNLVESVRAAGARGHHEHAVRLVPVVAALLERHGHHEDSRTVYEVALVSARTVGDRTAEATALVGIGTVHLALGNHAEARRCLIAGLRFTEDYGDSQGQAALLHRIGRLETAQGNHRAAITRYRDALEIVREVDDLHGLCWTHCRLGEAHRALAQYDEAFLHLNRAEWFAVRIGDQSALANCLYELGTVHRDLRALPVAIAHYERALLYLDTTPTPDLALTTRLYIAVTEVNLGRGALSAAMRSAQRTIDLAKQTYDIIAEARGYDLHGDVHAACHDPLSATNAWQLATDLYERTGMTDLASAVLDKIAAMPPDSAEPGPPRATVTPQGAGKPVGSRS